MLSLHATVTCGLSYLAVGAMIWAMETARGKYALGDFALEVMIGAYVVAWWPLVLWGIVRGEGGEG